jgi:hypothetical protein
MSLFGGGSKFPSYKGPAGGMPPYQPIDINALNALATQTSKGEYTAEQADLAARHPELVGAQKTFETQMASRLAGDQPLDPQVQATLMRSGLQGAAQSLGVSNLGTGSAGQAAAARNLGLNIQQYQQAQRQEALTEFSYANQLFPQRQLGIGGQGAAQAYLSNVIGTNNWNQARYASDVQQAQYQTNLAGQAAASAAGQSNATISTIGSVAGAAVAAVSFS